MTGKPIRAFPLVLKMVLLVAQIQNLYLDALGKPASGQLVQDRPGTPDEYAGIACPPVVAPLENHLEILVHLLRPKPTIRLAGAMYGAVVAKLEGVRIAVHLGEIVLAHHFPARTGMAVDEGFGGWFVIRLDKGDEKEDWEGAD